MRVGRFALPFVILILCAWGLSHRITPQMIAALPARLADIAPWQWAVAVALTGLSLFSVGCYDVLAHRYLRTRLPEGPARWTGSIGIAIGQTLGFGLLTGALARLRMLPALGLRGALKLSAFVSVSFVMAWITVFSGAALLLPTAAWVSWLGAAGSVASLALMLIIFRWPALTFGRFDLRLPSWRMCAGMVGWALVDTVTAAGVLYVMLPAGTLSFAAFFPVFLMAMGAALVSNTPGGLGPFELVMLSALGAVPVEAVMTAVLAYRCVYYGLPACLAALALLRPLDATPSAPPKAVTTWPDAPRSEVGVVRQNGGAVLRFGADQLALWPLGQALALLGDPVRGDDGATSLARLRDTARGQALIPLAYKIGARMALSARALGWRVLHVADDAIVTLGDFTLDAPRRRTLRRKLRAADKAGVYVQSDCALPYAQIAHIDRAWQRKHGRARGGSMGRYCPHYLVDQWVATAWQGDRCVAFVTAHMARDEWCLDIMRHGANVPDGTMHALVSAAIAAAQDAGAAQFCLASVPACPDPASPFWRWCARQLVTAAGGPGLRQFKSNFAPVWRARYVAAPSALGLVIGLADLARAIHKPPALASADTNAAHDLDENYELASQRAA